ncbi:YebC/PmpR family DNA-binding transcriptional regulator [Patescibacteria group bacterium]|nr:YebC/PmpR family DNA-binding transcriptional regulator [Patescibacteria group bacterium]MBU1956104.1 YebC/PmpR family DNA-binding transcriptional regulator [Patescibacteria group bacterium]
MSGHNKWSKIKHKKAASDSKKSKIYSKLVKLIQIESKTSNGDVSSPGLRSVIEKAKAENMPKETIDRAVKKGLANDTALMEHVVYEAYGPGGCAMIIEGITDNKNRSAAEIKHILSKNGLTLAAPGSAIWAFKKTDGVWVAETTTQITDTEEEKLEKLIEEITDQDDVQEVYINI